MHKTGKLIVFEGPDGVGKTALSRAFAERAKLGGLECEWLSFPGCEDGTLGKHVYEIHHSRPPSGVTTINATSLQLLHVAAHIDAIERRILPALKQGILVVLDRYWWSTFVYGIIAGVDECTLRAMIRVERLHWGKVRPACTFLLRRMPPSGEHLNPQLAALAREYEKLATRERGKHMVSIVDNDGTIDEALERIVGSVGLEERLSASVLIQEKSALPSGAVAQNRSGTAEALLLFHKLAPAKPTLVYTTYWQFAAERQAIFFRRFSGEAPPWTADPILQEYKFTNAYRASDRTSQYLIRDVIYAGPQTLHEIFFRTLLFKVFNRIETWELLTQAFRHISYREYSFARYDEVLTKAMSSGARIYSGAYIMPSGTSTSPNARKHRMHLNLIEGMLRDDLPQRLAEAPSMGKAFELLRAYPTLGDFLAYQYVTDLNYASVLNFSEMEFVVPGPGARDGIRKCFADFGGLTESDLIRLVADRQYDEFQRRGINFKSLWGRPLQLIDCQNLFCEVDKYSRVRHPEFIGRTGRSRIKQKYRITSTPLRFWYPPKWGLNDQIAAGGGACV
jgi:thymidylate kinase